MSRAELYFVRGPWKGRLAIAPRPRGGDWLELELQEWRSKGVQVVISLLEDSEELDLELRGERRACEQVGLEFLRLPIPDRGVPAARADLDCLVALAQRVLTAGHDVLVHCRQGIGRSSLVAGVVLMKAGQLSATEAWTRLEEARGRSVPDTLEQKAWLESL